MVGAASNAASRPCVLGRLGTLVDIDLLLGLIQLEPLDALEESLAGELRDAPGALAVTMECVRLTAGGLPIGKDGRVVTIQCLVHEVRVVPVVDLFRGRLLVVNSIKHVGPLPYGLVRSLIDALGVGHLEGAQIVDTLGKGPHPDRHMYGLGFPAEWLLGHKCLIGTPHHGNLALLARRLCDDLWRLSRVGLGRLAVLSDRIYRLARRRHGALQDRVWVLPHYL